MNNGTIIYVGGFELPDKNAAAHRVLSNAKIFRELGYKVVFIGIDKNLIYKNGNVGERNEIQGFESWGVPYPNTKLQWIDYLCSIKAFIKVIGHYSDIKAVICYDYQSFSFIRIKRYCIKTNTKIISDCAEWYSSKGSNIAFRMFKGIDTFIRMRIIQKHLDGLIVISRYLEEYYSKCKNVVKIPPLVDSMEDKWKLMMGKNDDIIRFVYAGSPGKHKDKINLIIKGLYDLKEKSNFKFYIIGITEEQYLDDHKDHKRIIRSLGDKIVFMGRLTHEDSLNYIKMADFSIFLREDTRVTNAGFPTKFVESIHCGTPVITTNTSDLDEFLIENENGYFIKLDTNNIKKSLRNILYTNREQILSMKKNCSNSNLFDYKNYVSIFMGFFE